MKAKVTSNGEAAGSLQEEKFGGDLLREVSWFISWLGESLKSYCKLGPWAYMGVGVQAVTAPHCLNPYFYKIKRMRHWMFAHFILSCEAQKEFLGVATLADFLSLSLIFSSTLESQALYL